MKPMEGQGGLIITRRIGEEVMINDGEMVIQVASIKGKQIKLYFRGNRDKYKLDRGEVWKALHHITDEEEICEKS